MKLRIGLLCLVGGLFFTLPALGVGHFGWYWLSGVLTVAALVPLVRFGPRSMWGQFCAIALVLVIIGLACTLSEGVVFFPEMKSQILMAIPGGTVMYLIVAALLMGLAKLLKVTNPEARQVPHRSSALVAPLILASGASYVLYYLVFGAAAFLFFTRKFYPHATEQVAAMGLWFWAYQLGRGVLMTLAVVPVIYALRMPRWKAAVVVGLLVWIVGGAAPLLVPTTVMVPAQRYMHIVEIMTQNVALGMTAVWLLRPKTKGVVARIEQTTIA